MGGPGGARAPQSDAWPPQWPPHLKFYLWLNFKFKGLQVSVAVLWEFPKKSWEQPLINEFTNREIKGLKIHKSLTIIYILQSEKNLLNSMCVALWPICIQRLKDLHNHTGIWS